MSTGNPRIFTLANPKHHGRSVTIGDGVPKLAVNLGFTNEYQRVAEEVSKAETAVKFGASMVADVTTKGEIASIHNALTSSIEIPLNTVPLYEIYQKARTTNSWKKKLPKSLVLDIVEAQAERGIDCMTFHNAYLLKHLELVRDSPRKIRVQARGGGIIHEYFLSTGQENPLYEYFDEILEILRRYSVALSIGCSLRTGTIDDPIDEIALNEIITSAELVSRAMAVGVGVMVEGFSHIKFGMITPYVRMIKMVCHQAPIRLLGPLGTEKGLGYDHITAAICGTEALRAGTDIITVVTRAEHIGIPNTDEIREALVAARIAIELATQPWAATESSGSFLCGLGFENLRDDNVFDLARAIELKAEKNQGNIAACSMCSEMCRIRLNPNIARMNSTIAALQK